MASASRHGGPSLTAEEAADPDLPSSLPIRVRRPEIGLVDREPFNPVPVPEGEIPFPGDNSNPSMPKQSTSDVKPKATPRKPALTTGNRSNPDETETDSSVPSTDGSGPTIGSPPSDDVDFDI